MHNAVQLWKPKNSIFLLTLIAILTGCAGSPDIISTEKSPGQAYSAAEIREMAVDHPQFISGDYFRKKEFEPTGATGEASPTENQEKTAQDSDTALAAAVSAARDDGNGPMKIKTALLIDQSRVSGNNADLLTDAATAVSAMFPVVLLSSMEVEASVSQWEGSDPNDLVGVAESLAVYPGVRMLILVDVFEPPPTYPGKARAVITLVDTGILHRYPPMEVSLRLTSEADAAFFAETVAGTAFERVEDRGALTPWFCRAFSHDENAWYVNAGKESGLETGAVLKVVSEGKLVKAPSGTPAGWLPGEVKGKLRVERHFGRDLSACSLVGGQGPGDGDLLMK